MCPTTSVSIYSRLHFLQIERSVQTKKEDGIKYIIKNHFNSPVVRVEGKKSDLGDNLELNIIDLLMSKEISTSNVLFRLTLSIQPTYYSDGAPTFQECTLLSSSGEMLGRVVNVKDMGLSTCSDNIMDGANQLLFQVHRKFISKEHSELHIKPVSKEIAIARISMEKNKTFLSMAPELDSDTKMRLICLMIYKELGEKLKADFSQDGQGGTGIQNPAIEAK